MDINNSKENVECPFCKSKNIKIIIEKKNEDFDITSGVIGTICLGLLDCCVVYAVLKVKKKKQHAFAMIVERDL